MHAARCDVVDHCCDDVESSSHDVVACRLAEQSGIVVIDEIDKIVSTKQKYGGDASAEGVQRDLLPLIEGTVLDVKRFGQVRTDYILFIARCACVLAVMGMLCGLPS